MSLPRDDDRVIDEFAAEDGAVIRDLSEEDPFGAFAAEAAAASPPEREAAPEISYQDAPRLTLASEPMPVPRRERVSPLALALPLVALLSAAGAWIYLDNSAAPPDRKDARTDTAPTSGTQRESHADATPFTEVEMPAPADASIVGERQATNGEQQAHVTPAPATVPAPQAKAPVPQGQEPAGQANARPPASVRRQRPNTPAPAAVAKDDGWPALSGEWVMNTRVESSRLGRYEGLRLGYLVNLEQDGNRVSGAGWKVTEGERTIRPTGRTPISFDGLIVGDRVELTFTEGGRVRTTAGKLVLARDSDNVLRGRFSSTAAQSAGVVEIHR